MDASEIRSLLADSPDLETALEALREVDRETETWGFDDVPVDSGAFGELVGEGVVESVGDEYRLADPEAVDRALDGGAPESDSDEGFEFGFSLPEIDRTAAGVLGLVVLVTVAVRATNYRSVFRDRVVFTGNDPYAYVYVVEQGLQHGWSLSELPGLVDEPLTVSMLLYISEFAGGFGSHQAILAWAPVIVAVATVLVLYLFVLEFTDDRRIALGAAFALAVMPVHAQRSSLGFVDHHVFDYFWLVIVAWGLTLTLSHDELEPDWETVRGIGLLAVGVAGLVLAWWAGTLLLAPIGIAILVGGVVAVREDESFLAPGAATCAGVGIGAVLILVAHRIFGWHEQLIVAVPFVLFGGAVVMVAATALWRRFEVPAWAFPTTGIGVVVVTTLGVYLLAPETWVIIERNLRRLAGIGYEDIAEAQSVFSTTTMGWLFLFGLFLLFAIPYMAWGAYAVLQGNRQWLGVTAYAWFMLALASSMSRYAGESSPFIAVFVGLGFVHVLHWIGFTETGFSFEGTIGTLSLPDSGTTMRVVLVVVLISSVSLAMAPILATNLSFGDEQYETAVFIDDHAAEHEYEYPESYVFSPWSWSRMYNYHVSGEARSYGHAIAHYREFSYATDSEEAINRVNAVPGNDKYVVTESLEVDVPPESMQSRLHDRYGSRGEEVDGLARFRALYASSSGDYKVFRYVPGATIEGEADAESVQISTPVDIEGASFTYEREVVAENGRFAVTVPYPGEYELDGAAIDAVTVEEGAVFNGTNVSAAD